MRYDLFMNLGQHTVRSYDQQLQQLLKLILDMGGEVRKMVLAARESFRSQNEDRVTDAKVADRIINDLDQQVEDAATVVLALQNPMAIDLRFVTSVLKITGMLERSGDLAKNAIKRSVKMSKATPEEVIKKLEIMADIIIEMLDTALEAFAEKDTFKAMAVWKRDDEIDNLYHEIFTIIQKNMIEDPANAESSTHVIFAAKNLERLADYTTNLAKTVYYVTSGKRVDKAYLKELASSATTN
jgi:phosphate transport system protein